MTNTPINTIRETISNAIATVSSGQLQDYRDAVERSLIGREQAIRSNVAALATLLGYNGSANDLFDKLGECGLGGDYAPAQPATAVNEEPAPEAEQINVEDTSATEPDFATIQDIPLATIEYHEGENEAAANALPFLAEAVRDLAAVIARQQG